MNFVIDAEACVACLACVRACPTDAIAVAGEAPLLQIVDELCIRCGQCFAACPHEAVRVGGEVGKALAIAAQGNGVLILSPEAAAHFYPASPEQVVNACYEAGFRTVSRGVIGDELVAAEYLRLWEEEQWGTMVRSTDTARASAPSASTPRTTRNRPVVCRNSSSIASGIPPAALRCRRRSSGTRWKYPGCERTLTPRTRKISSRSPKVIAASRSGLRVGGLIPA